MQLTKQQKIYATVLGLALAAFAFDRWVLGPADADTADDVAVSPASSARQAPRRPAPRLSVASTASPAPAPAVFAPGNPVAGGPGGSSSPATFTTPTQLAARLQAVAQAQKLDLDHVGDAFRPSVKWVGAPRHPSTNKELTDAVKEFQKHKLMAVMTQTGGGVAIIDKWTVNVGQTLDGFRLVAVKDRSAILRKGNQKVELKLATEDGLAGGGVSGAGVGTSEKIAGADPQN